jgi:hypothetical protein
MDLEGGEEVSPLPPEVWISVQLGAGLEKKGQDSLPTEYFHKVKRSHTVQKSSPKNAQEVREHSDHNRPISYRAVLRKKNHQQSLNDPQNSPNKANRLLIEELEQRAFVLAGDGGRMPFSSM